MPDSELQIGLIKDILLPVDPQTRYDVYFTDKRIAIVCMGPSNRFDGVSESRSFLFGVAPEALTNAYEERKNRQTMEAEINLLPINEKLKLSKKSCFYTYQEIEEIKLISGKKPKFAILSEECISKFAPNIEQFKQLANLLPNIEALKGKTSIIGNLTLDPLQVESITFVCQYCSSKNDADALFCDKCGMKIKEETLNPNELTCSSCGSKNKMQASFCKRCGSPLHA
jgi:ribosomal protein L40E